VEVAGVAPRACVANEKWQIKIRYPTQAKTGLEWDTQHLLPVWQKKALWASPVGFNSEPVRSSHFRGCWVPHSSPVFGLEWDTQHSAYTSPSDPQNNFKVFR
jgi:hypothetical protein